MLITFEGMDGCGKTTQAMLFARYLSEIYGEDNVVLTREPGGTSFNELLREMLLCSTDYKADSTTELFLFLATRRESFSKVINNALRQNKIVVSDRCIDSTVAYQGYGHGINLELIEQLNAIATEGRSPDITFVIDVPVEESLSRASRNGYESSDVDFYNRVRDGFRYVAEKNPHRCRLIQCLESEEVNDIYDVHKKVVELFNEHRETLTENTE